MSPRDFQDVLYKLTSKRLDAQKLREVMVLVGQDGDDSIDWREFCNVARSSSARRQPSACCLRTLAEPVLPYCCATRSGTILRLRQLLAYGH